MTLRGKSVFLLECFKGELVQPPAIFFFFAYGIVEKIALTQNEMTKSSGKSKWMRGALILVNLDIYF